MKRTLITIFEVCFIILFNSCVTTNQSAVSQRVQEQGDTVYVDNPTQFDIYFEGNQKVENGAKRKEIFLALSSNILTSGFDVTYEIPLSESMSLFCSGDNLKIRKEEPSTTIQEPRFTRDYGTWIRLINKSNVVISLQERNRYISSWEQKGSHLQGNVPAMTNKGEFHPGETTLFFMEKGISYDNYSILASQKNIPIKISSKLEKNHLYSYTFDGKTASLTDERPLVCVGEPSWSRKLDGTNLPVFAEYADRSIKAAIPSNNGVDFIALGALGEETNKKTVNQYGGNAILSAILNTDENSYLLAGYGTKPARQFLVKQTSTDEIAWSMTFQQRTGYKLNTVIPKGGNTYFVAGTVDDSAYMREIEDKGKSGVSVWELWAGDVNKNWKTAQSAAYNAKNNTYIIAGMYGGIDPISGKQNAFIGFVEPSGTTGKIKNDIILKDSIINQVLCDSKGNFYIAGQESRDGIVYAIIQKYSGDGKKLWQQAEELKANSLYRCAILDEENDQIVLGGTMNATDKYGNKGTPFLQGIDIANGKELWIENISAVSKDLSLVTGLQKAKDYGFITTLYGISGGKNSFAVARLNSRGKLVNHKSY